MNGMEKSIKLSWRDQLADIPLHRYVYHGLFWLAMLLILMALLQFFNRNLNFWFFFSTALIYVFFYALIVYYNLLYLIPHYLSRKKFFQYALLLVLTVVVVTPIKILVLYLRFTGIPDFQQSLVNNQMLILVSDFSVLGASTIFQIVTDWARHLKERQELETQTMQSELNFLKSQINPHFLFNTLNNLYALTLKKDEKAPEIVIKLSEMMRYMLYECNEKRVPLAKEIHYIQNYLDLEQLRQGEKVNISFEVQGNPGNYTIAPLLFIPFLENSFKHGLSNNIAPGFVNINLSIEGSVVHFNIENSKPEKAPLPNPNRRSGGIGLVNVHRRLNLIYPDQYDLRIDNKPKTYVVDLQLELD